MVKNLSTLVINVTDCLLWLGIVSGSSRRLDVPYLVTKAPGAAPGLSFIHAKLRLLYLGGGLGRAAPTCICWGDGCAECPCCVATSMQRPRCARCPPMVDETLPRSPCLQRADEGHTVVDALGRPPTPPTQGPPRDLGTPLSRRPNPCPGRGSRWHGASANNSVA